MGFAANSGGYARIEWQYTELASELTGIRNSPEVVVEGGGGIWVRVEWSEEQWGMEVVLGVELERELGGGRCRG